VFLTDRDCISIDDITAVDPEVASIAATESIPTEGDSSFVHLAVVEAGNRILGLMQNFSYPHYTSSGTQPSPGLFFPAYDATPTVRIRLGQIVTDSDTSTFQSPLKQWITYVALKNFYRLVSNRLLEDRYEKKRRDYECAIDDTYWPALKACGLPMCYNPIPCPGALYEVGQGIWSASNLAAVPGSGVGNTFDVAITWAGAQGESAPSQTQTITIPAGHVLEVTISSLVVPTVAGTSMASWNIYAGITGSTLFSQATVPVATKTFTLAGDPLLSGTIAGTGQPKDTSLTFINLFSRA